MKNREITKEEINKITERCRQPREKAFFTLMRQSGLSPHTIKQLRIKNLEKILDPNPPIPCKIDISHTFIGDEAVRHLKEYFLTGKNLTQESLLFTPKNNPNKEINTKDISRAFKLTAQKLVKEGKINYEIRKGKPSELTLFSLIDFYRKHAKYYLAELNNNIPKDDEFHRKLYEKEAMPFLEIETPTPIQIQQLRRENKELSERFKKLEDKFPEPEEPPPEYWQQMEEEIREHEEYEKWLKKHPEEAKRLEQREKEYDKYLEEHPEIFEEEEKRYREYLEAELEEIRNKMKEIQNIVRKPPKT
jgi:hypothetical protein